MVTIQVLYQRHYTKGEVKWGNTLCPKPLPVQAKQDIFYFQTSWKRVHSRRWFTKELMSMFFLQMRTGLEEEDNENMIMKIMFRKLICFEVVNLLVPAQRLKDRSH